MSKEDQRREYNEQKELENLRRVFEAIDKNRDSKLDAKELNAVLVKLGYTAKKQEIEDMIWEVDEDCDKCVSWDEFKLMFERCRTDKTGLEPRKLFNVVEFMMHDKDASGTIDMDECMEILFRRFGKDQLEQRTNGAGPRRPLGHMPRRCGWAHTRGRISRRAQSCPELSSARATSRLYLSAAFRVHLGCISAISRRAPAARRVL